MPNSLARKLRAQPSDAEKLLWQRLRAKQIERRRFRRQYPVGSYVVDFVCLSARLIIEVDGGQHAIHAAQDETRSAWLRGEGFRVILFWNNDVLENIDGVLFVIVENLLAETTPPPDLLPQGKEEL